VRRAALVLLAWLAPVGAACAQQGVGDVVYVPTPQVVVDTMLRMANVGEGDYLIDLGSGDGRTVITAAKRGARALGVDLDRHLLGLANEAAQREGVTGRASFREQNLFETDLADATVVTTYLLPEMNLKLRPKILALKPGTRVVAHDYHMGDWLPDDRDIPSVPEKKVGAVGLSYIYLWHVPARVGAVERGHPVRDRDDDARVRARAEVPDAYRAGDFGRRPPDPAASTDDPRRCARVRSRSGLHPESGALFVPRARCRRRGARHRRGVRPRPRSARASVEREARCSGRGADRLIACCCTAI
jgi:hypothetical protein